MDEKLAQFISITGAKPESAQFYLDSANGDIETAIETFLESSGRDDGAVLSENVPSASIGAHQSSSAQQSVPAVAPSSKPSGKKPASGGGNVRSLADLGGDESDSDDDYNDLYVGGEKSGQVVKGAPKDKKVADDKVEGLFEKAKQAGATQGTAADLHPAGDSHKPSGFGGSARRLDGQEAPPAPQGVQQPQQKAPSIVTIKFYEGGIFTVNDGPPRNVADPAEQPFMESIMHGECPAELEPPAGSAPVTVNLIRVGNEYQEPEKPKYTAFTGAGHTLSGPDSAGASSSHSAPPLAAAISLSTEWSVDEAQPTTSIQLRLHDGSRMVARFNLTHTVGHIRLFIRASRPDMTTAYRLVTAFPASQLNDDSVTIAAAGLQNAVVVQKL